MPTTVVALFGTDAQAIALLGHLESRGYERARLLAPPELRTFHPEAGYVAYRAPLLEAKPATGADRAPIGGRSLFEGLWRRLGVGRAHGPDHILTEGDLRQAGIPFGILLLRRATKRPEVRAVVIRPGAGEMDSVLEALQRVGASDFEVY